jgi:DNA-directed RNA polymerase specialized sigma subunit
MAKKKNDIFTRKKVKESDFLAALDTISKKLIYKFKFGYHEIDDMKQQAAIFAIEGLEHYDNKRPLENFLWTHVRNRLFNFKRDNYFRPESVCTSCPFFDPKFKKSKNQCSKFTNKDDCEIYNQWTDRNQLKKNIMQPANIEFEGAGELHSTKDMTDIVGDAEIIKLIEDNINTKYRETYIRLKGGAKVHKQDLIKLQKHIKDILDKHNLSRDNDG